MWVIKLRWLASVAVLIGGLVARMLGYALPFGAIVALAAYLMAANVTFLMIARRFTCPNVRGRSLRFFTNVQIVVDWIAVLVLIHLTGGIESPLVYFFFFHLVLASILLPVLNIYINATFAVLLMGALFAAEYAGIIPHRSLHPEMASNFYRMPQYVFAHFGVLVVSIYVTVSIASWISELLRNRLIQLFDTTHKLEESTQRMEAIYNVIRLIGVHSELGALLGAVIEQAKKLLGIKAAFIALYDTDSRELRIASSSGIDLESSPIELDFLKHPQIAKPLSSGEIVIIDDLSSLGESNPDIAALCRQNLNSMMLVPLETNNQTIGIFSLCSERKSRFNQTDGKYFRIFCDLIAIEIELARTNEILQLYNQTRTWFYRKAAHDLRAPLAAIRSMLDLITEGYVQDMDKIKDLVSRASNRAAGLSEMVNDLLTLAEEKLDTVAPELAEVDPKEVLKETFDTYEPQARKKGIEISLEIDPDVQPIRATHDGLSRIMNNLISNAVKYTPEGGRIEIELSALPYDFVKFRVTDTGIGIPEDARANLFKEFYRASNAKKMKEDGTGLGLVIAKKLVEEFGGNINYDSKEGEGTTFVVVLPSVKSSIKNTELSTETNGL